MQAQQNATGLEQLRMLLHELLWMLLHATGLEQQEPWQLASDTTDRMPNVRKVTPYPDRHLTTRTKLQQAYSDTHLEAHR